MKQSIKNISNSLNNLKENFNNFILREKENRNLLDIVYQEYTLEDIIKDTDFLIKILNYLVKSHNLFFNISTQGERNNIFNSLNNLNSYFSNSSFNHIISHLDTLKTYVRNYNPIVLSKKDFLSDIGKDILEIESNFKISSALLEKIDSDIKKKEEIIDKLNKLEDDYNDLESKLEIVSEKKEEIIEMTTNAESNKKIIDAFSSEIEKRNEDLVKIKNKTEEYEKKLENFTEEHKTKLEEANKLIEDAKKALNYTTAEGISAAIQTQYDEANKWYKTVPWLLSSIFFLLITLLLGVMIIFPEIITHFFKEIKINNSSPSYYLIARFLLLPITISGVVFSASQYVKQKNIIEDYAYKLVLVKSIIGFSEELLKIGNNTNEGYQKYITKTLDELLQDPLRGKNIKKSDKTISSKELKTGLELLKQAKETLSE